MKAYGNGCVYCEIVVVVDGLMVLVCQTALKCRRNVITWMCLLEAMSMMQLNNFSAVLKEEGHFIRAIPRVALRRWNKAQIRMAMGFSPEKYLPFRVG